MFKLASLIGIISYDDETMDIRDKHEYNRNRDK